MNSKKNFKRIYRTFDKNKKLWQKFTKNNKEKQLFSYEKLYATMLFCY